MQKFAGIWQGCFTYDSPGFIHIVGNDRIPINRNVGNFTEIHRRSTFILKNDRSSNLEHEALDSFLALQSSKYFFFRTFCTTRTNPAITRNFLRLPKEDERHEESMQVNLDTFDRLACVIHPLKDPN